ncbi:MAG: 5-methyltetrahydropteroyltriglutamate--homocysteine S-methyltransferase [Alphaproteobacteria bacterium]|nr:MAG: 5-methyltetrahydropteroyltriglutamate--homocysteine S-methyltransferase [Alphaproteobacteria bacterium]
MKRTKPPFRADHVGSFLRPAALKDARAKREKGAITQADLKAIEDREIEKVVKKQEELGLQLATDGEFRRSWWHFDFLGMLDGVEIFEAEQGIQFRGVQTKAQGLRIVGKIAFSNHPMLEHFKFLKAHTKVTPKMTIPAPPVLHFRLPKDGVNKSVYPDHDQFFQDVGNAYKQAVKAFYDAGCRYLQFNTALEAKPADMTITTHVCRGNFRSTWISEGGYEPVAETLLGKVNYDGYFLEYDTERAGGFEPLRFLPKGNKVVVLGLVTSKSGTLEKKDDLKRRIDEAGKFAPIEQFCLSPQCGFASTEEGNILAEEEQWAKLRMIVDVADEIWGR